MKYKAATRNIVKMLVTMSLGFVLLATVQVDTADAAAQEHCAGTILDGGCYVPGIVVSQADCVAPYFSVGTTCTALNTGSDKASVNAYSCPAAPGVVQVNMYSNGGVSYVESCEYAPPVVCNPGITRIDGGCWIEIGFTDPPAGGGAPAAGSPQSVPVEAGSITLTYTVDCVGEGIARVSLGTPIVSGGAVVSLITVNGSATVGADIAGGSTVLVQLTAGHPSDVVNVVGPNTAPSCTTAVPVASAAPVPPAVAPAPTATPVPTATPASADAAAGNDGDEATADAEVTEEPDGAEDEVESTEVVQSDVDAADLAMATPASVDAEEVAEEVAETVEDAVAPAAIPVSVDVSPAQPVAVAAPTAPTSPVILLLAGAGIAALLALALYGAATLVRRPKTASPF